LNETEKPPELGKLGLHANRCYVVSPVKITKVGLENFRRFLGNFVNWHFGYLELLKI